MTLSGTVSKIVIVIMYITSHVTSTIEQWYYQPSEAASDHSQVWSMASY